MTLPRMWIALVLTVLLGGCAIAPTHPALQDAPLPPLIPVREFVANVEGTSLYRLSPDGASLAWKGVSGLRPAVWVKKLASGDTRAIAVRARGIVWSGDSRFLFMTVDRTGDENTHVLAVDIARGDSQPVDLTPFQGARSQIMRRIENSPEILVISNVRDHSVFDVYRINPATRGCMMVAQNPGNVASWYVDRKGRVRARSVFALDAHYLQVPGGDTWRTTMQ